MLQCLFIGVILDTCRTLVYSLFLLYSAHQGPIASSARKLIYFLFPYLGQAQLPLFDLLGQQMPPHFGRSCNNRPKCSVTRRLYDSRLFISSDTLLRDASSPDGFLSIYNPHSSYFAYFPFPLYILYIFRSFFLLVFSSFAVSLLYSSDGSGFKVSNSRPC